MSFLFTKSHIQATAVVPSTAGGNNQQQSQSVPANASSKSSRSTSLSNTTIQEDSEHEDFQVVETKTPAPTEATMQTYSKLLSKFRNSLGGMSVAIPKLTTTNRIRHRFRYYTSTAASDTWNWKNLYLAMGVSASSTVAYGLFGSVRLISISVYYPNNASTTAVSDLVGIYWAPGVTVGVPDVQTAPLEIGSLGSKVTLRPPKNSSISEWQNGNTAAQSSALFIVVNNNGCILDMDLEATVVDSVYTSTTGTGVAMNVGYGTSNVPNTNWVPLGYLRTV